MTGRGRTAGAGRGRASSAGERLADGRGARGGVAGGGDDEADRLDYRRRRDDEKQIRGGGRVRERRRMAEGGQPLGDVLLIVEPERVALVDVAQLAARHQQGDQRDREQHHAADAAGSRSGRRARVGAHGWCLYTPDEPGANRRGHSRAWISALTL